MGYVPLYASRMTIVGHLLRDIDAFIVEARVAESTFGRRAVNDGKFVGRLRSGAGVTAATVDRVRSYIHEQRSLIERSKPRRGQ